MQLCIDHAYKILAKLSENTLWELISYVDFIENNIVYFIISKFCALFYNQYNL